MYSHLNQEISSLENPNLALLGLGLEFMKTLKIKNLF